MSNIISPSFWFSSRPGSLSSTAFYFFIALIGIFIISTVVLSFLKKGQKNSIYKDILANISSFLTSNLIISLILFFFMFEEIPFLSSRAWFLIWGISMIVWLVIIFKKILKIPSLKEEKIKQQEFNKYIP